MRVRLLKPYRGRKAGAEFVPAWDAEAKRLIRDGVAEAVSPGQAPAPEPKAAARPAAAPKPAPAKPSAKSKKPAPAKPPATTE